jgi:hypothetical protein
MHLHNVGRADFGILKYCSDRLAVDKTVGGLRCTWITNVVPYALIGI